MVHGNERPIDVTLPEIDGRHPVRLAVVERRRGAQRRAPVEFLPGEIVPLVGTSMQLFRAE